MQVATLHSPFAKTLIVDSDVYACSNFVSLFNEWLEDAEFAITLAPAPFGSTRNYAGAFRAGFPERYVSIFAGVSRDHMLLLLLFVIVVGDCGFAVFVGRY